MDSIDRKRRTARCIGWMLSICLALAVITLGCSGRGSKPPTVKLHGKVSYQGQPVSQGTVTFQPTKPAEGYPFRPATGVLNTDGTYELSTFDKGDGAIPGEYQVMIVSLTSGPTPETPNAPEVWAVPKKYGNSVQSPLKVAVPAEQRGPLEMDFTLEN